MREERDKEIPRGHLRALGTDGTIAVKGEEAVKRTDKMEAEKRGRGERNRLQNATEAGLDGI